ncbi:MAG: class I SAM-dependent RNA methyltransferase [Clostridia bacterium]|nr:class I SAM-dependent RNA methyltransferase [Clostridia bacterium]
MNINFVIPCLLGMESLISKELKTLEAENIAAENGRVLFSGDENILARVNICSRFAERVQILIGSFEAESFEDLFQGTKSLEWENWISSTDAFPVKGYSINSTLFSVRDCQAIIKKAVVERLKSKYHIEWFEETGPVHQIQFSINKNTVSLVIDTSGQGLHKRGYRTEANEAPIKETLAAALCDLSYLKPYHKLYDPMCGSGTILIEGALMARNIAPGINRNFSAERFDVLPREIWLRERERARSLERECRGFFAYGSDIDGNALQAAKSNAERAGVADLIEFKQTDVRNFSPQTETCTLITNPPYGERMLDTGACEMLYKDIGKVFERRRGHSYTIISPDEEFEAAFGRKADKRRKLYNGMIKCLVYMYYK